MRNDEGGGPSRREFLRRSGVATVAGGVVGTLAGRQLSAPVEAREAVDEAVFEASTDRRTAEVFPQSVASGGPTPEGVLLWTRVDPALADDGTRPLGVEVADDAAFDEIVYRGMVPPSEIGPGTDHTVKVDLDGRLAPDREYRYRFTFDGTRSRVGRCRTLPASDASPDGVSFVVLTCQDYQNGYYPALGYAAEEDVDFAIHLGDFIYESANGKWKGEFADDYEGRGLTLPSGHDIAWELADFRYLHRTYRTDRFLQELMESHTMILGWDDHEVVNNWYWDYEAGAPASGFHPRGDDPEFMTDLTADGIQAWWEYLPARVDYDPGADHLHEAFDLSRSFSFGDLVDLLFTDERLFRDAPPCEEVQRGRTEPTCPQADDPSRTMLGERQREWFLDGLRESSAAWTTWANEVLTVPIEAGEGPLTVPYRPEMWGGYTHERTRIMETVRDHVEDFVTLTGDLHAYMAAYQQVEYADPAEDNGTNPAADPDNRVGVELMTPAVTSLNLVDQTPGPGTEAEARAVEAAVRSNNRHIEYFEGYRWGYSVVDFTPDECRYRAYSVDKKTDDPDARRRLVKSLRVPRGEVAIEETDETVSGHDPV